MKRKAEYRKMPPGERQAMLAARPGDGDGRRARSSKRPGARRCRQGGGRGRDPRPRHPARHHHRRPSGEDHARAGTPVCRRHRRTRACREQRPEAEPADGRQPAIVEETVAACDACGADIDCVDPVDRERRTTSCSRSRRAEECPKCKGRFPDNIPCSTASRPSSSTCWSPGCCPCAVVLVQAISSSPRPRPCFHDASWEKAAVAHLLQRPMSTISDQPQVAPCRRDVQVPAPQARDRPVLQGRPGPRTWQCSHQRQPPAARTDLRRRGYRATDEEPAPCHKVNKSASKTLNEAGRKRTIRAPGNCPTSRRRKENASQTRTTCVS